MRADRAAFFYAQALMAALSSICPTKTHAAQPRVQAEVKIVRLDCGSIEERNFSSYSDTHALDGHAHTLVDSCYLIQHGSIFLLWETGLPLHYAGKSVTQDSTVMSLSKTIVSQLRQLGIEPRQIRYVGLSHYHDDHTGQAVEFAAATLLVGSDDWEALRTARPGRFDAAGLAPWVTGGGAVEAIRGDRDIFGDGSVTMLATPGHTPGHHSLLVRLSRGPILLTGDAVHTAQNYAKNEVPAFNVNRADTLASISRLEAIARNVRATVIIQHEARDVAKLPAFPNWAR